MNAFFASVEQANNLSLVGKPIAIVHNVNYKGSLLVTRSYEAKDQGISKFMQLEEALSICPELIALEGDFEKYFKVNKQLHKILAKYSPFLEAYSIDEFFIDLTSYFNLHSINPRQLAKKIKLEIFQNISPQIKCSIGIGPNKLLAKVGSDFQKPDGLTHITHSNKFDYLDKMKLSDIWGIGNRSAQKLNDLGITSTRQIRKLDSKILEGMVGSYWMRLRNIAQGIHFEKVTSEKYDKPQKSMQHAHTLDKATFNIKLIKYWIYKLSYKLAFRLRKANQMAGSINLHIRPANQKRYGWGTHSKHYAEDTLCFDTNDGYEIYTQACNLLSQIYSQNFKIRMISAGVNKLSTSSQLKIRRQSALKKEKANSAMDKVANKFGKQTVKNVTHNYFPFHPN
jgi:DNA polymerase-4